MFTPLLALFAAAYLALTDAVSDTATALKADAGSLRCNSLLQTGRTTQLARFDSSPGEALLQTRIKVSHDDTFVADEAVVGQSRPQIEQEQPKRVKAQIDLSQIGQSKAQGTTKRMHKTDSILDNVQMAPIESELDGAKKRQRAALLESEEYLKKKSEAETALMDKFLLWWQQWHKTWRQSVQDKGVARSLLGLYRGVVDNEPMPVPVRSGRQLTFVFVAVFVIVGLSWTMFAVTLKLNGGETFRRLRLLVFCLSLGACSWGMTVANKQLMLRIQSPGLVIAIQMIIGVVAAIFLSGGQLSLESTQVKRWIIVPIFACVQLWTSLYTMKYLTLSTLMIVRNLGPLVTLPCEMAVMPASKRPAATFSTVFALVLVLSSAATYFGGTAPSWKGVGFAFLNMILSVIDVVLRRRLLTTECSEMSTTMCMLMNNLVGVVPSILLCVCTGELSEIEGTTAFTSYTIMVLLISGVIGAGISYFALNVQREMAATSFMVLENGIRLAEVLAGILLLKDPLTWPSQMLGLLVSYCGSLWYAKAQIDSGSDAASCKLDL